MDALTKAGITLVAIGAIVTLGACTGQSIGTLFTAGRQVPHDAIVLAPNERITLNARTAGRREYFCTNGLPLQCDRLSFKLYCHCPAGRAP